MNTQYRVAVVSLATCLVAAALFCNASFADEGAVVHGAELQPIPFPEPEVLAELPVQLAEMTELVQQIPGAEGQVPSRRAVGAAYGALARLYHAYGLLEPAEACYLHARRYAPDDYRWPYYLALMQQQKGELDAALASWANTVSLRASSAALYHMAEVLLAQGRIDEAAAVLGNGYKNAPGSAATAALLGQTLLVLGRGDEAVGMLEAFLAQHPEEGALHLVLAKLYRALGDEENASRHDSGSANAAVSFSDSLMVDLVRLRDESQRSMLVGQAALETGRVGDAVHAFRNAAAAQPERVEPRLALGRAMMLNGDPEAAQAQLQRVLEMAPETAEASHLMGILMVQKGDLETALEYLMFAASIDSESAAVQLDLAQALVAAGRREESLSYFAAAARLTPEDPRPWIGGSAALLQLQRYAEAVEVLTQAQLRLPGHNGIASALVRLLAACPDTSVRDGERALQLALALHERAPSVHGAEDVALAMAELGRCQDAATWQQMAIDLATLEAKTDEIANLKDVLTFYKDHDPCRFPAVSGSEP